SGGHSRALMRPRIQDDVTHSPARPEALEGRARLANSRPLSLGTNCGYAPFSRANHTTYSTICSHKGDLEPAPIARPSSASGRAGPNPTLGCVPVSRLTARGFLRRRRDLLCLRVYPAARDRLRKVRHQLRALLPGDAAVGDADAVGELLTRNEVLPAEVQV